MKARLICLPISSDSIAKSASKDILAQSEFLPSEDTATAAAIADQIAQNLVEQSADCLPSFRAEAIAALD